MFPYVSDAPMTTLGVFHAEITSARKLAEAKIYVVKGSCGSLLSYKIACDLCLMKIYVNTLHSRYEQPTTTIDALEKQYPHLFNGIGKFKNLEVNLHIDETVRPLAQPHRRVPFHLQKKVEDELQLLLEQDIIERAGGDEPTPWISSVVTPLKPKDHTKVRICVDMRKRLTPPYCVHITSCLP